MLVRQSWYVAAWADEIAPGSKLGRPLQGEPVLLYRGDSGAITALEDRCWHRGLPLSHGCVRDEQIQCGYHVPRPHVRRARYTAACKFNTEREDATTCARFVVLLPDCEGVEVNSVREQFAIDRPSLPSIQPGK